MSPRPRRRHGNTLGAWRACSGRTSPGRSLGGGGGGVAALLADVVGVHHNERARLRFIRLPHQPHLVATASLCMWQAVKTLREPADRAAPVTCIHDISAATSPTCWLSLVAGRRRMLSAWLAYVGLRMPREIGVPGSTRSSPVPSRKDAAAVAGHQAPNSTPQWATAGVPPPASRPLPGAGRPAVPTKASRPLHGHAQHAAGAEFDPLRNTRWQ